MKKKSSMYILLLAVLFSVGLGGRAQAYSVSHDMLSIWLDVRMPIYGPVYSPSYSYMSADAEAPTRSKAAEAVTYQVHAGDTLYQIARNFGITVDQIVAFNDITEVRRLKVGQTLHIPSTATDLTWHDGESSTIGKVLHTTLTAYTAGVESTGKTPAHPQYGITYSGHKAKEGRTIAVDPSVIPLGSTVYIDGIGIRIAEDIGSAIRGSRIDVFMNDVKQARQFGVKKNVKVYVLNKDQA